ncbi:DUF4097 family beta strand repeat-containing protein [Ferrimonas balearica]|uniref:DUF4097 family beta strand repeat-containing protein n=1 Tax=Ferrimonas balearica TaxID=44012 RepID=UPI001C99CD0B|nr:DUF4097 family beta strand repeat-containing protein [Ferrimonas balearica]MBY5993512.1 DUF4097 domain-containing protein [Ferrimonas balearica]
MNIKMIAGLLSWALVAPLAAAEAVDRSLPLGNANEVRIDIPRGKISLIGTQGDEISVQGELDEDTEAFEFAQEGDAVVVKLRLPDSWYRSNNGNNDKGAKLTIYYPQSAPLQFDTVAADVRAQRLGPAQLGNVSGDFHLKDGSAELKASTVSGDISAQDLSGELALVSVSGDIEGRALSGTLRLETVSGDIELRDATGSALTLETVSGDAELAMAAPSQLRGRTVSGELTVQLERIPGEAEVALESVSGDILLAVAGEIDAQIRAETGPGGRVRNDVSDQTPQRGKYVSNESLDITLGQGGGSVRLNTVSGDLRLKK